MYLRWPVNCPHKGPVTRKCFHLMTSSHDKNSHCGDKTNSTMEIPVLVRCSLYNETFSSYLSCIQVGCWGLHVSCAGVVLTCQAHPSTAPMGTSMFASNRMPPEITAVSKWSTTYQVSPPGWAHRIAFDLIPTLSSSVRIYDNWLILHNYDNTNRFITFTLGQSVIDMIPWASCQIGKIADCACAGNAGNVSPSSRVSDPDIHYSTCCDARAMMHARIAK